MTETWNTNLEERELLSTSDEEIIRKHQNFSFDLDEFFKRTQNGDYWQQLIQAHLYFEHVISQILTEALTRPEAISLSRMGFSQRLDLIVALALLPDELIAPIRKISSMRNKISHSLTFEITDNDIRDLEKCTPAHLRDALRPDADGNFRPLKLREILMVILLKADIIRQQRAAGRQINKKAELRLRKVLEETHERFPDILKGR